MTGPFWLAPRKRGSEGVDNLGLRQPGLTMADALFTGFTNTTTTPRYYSILSWLYTHAQSRAHLDALEVAFVHSTHIHEHQGSKPTGVVGTTRVPPRDGNRLKLRREDGEHIVSARDAAFYGPSALGLGLVGISPEGAYQHTPLAKELADTFEITAASIPDPDALSISVQQAEGFFPLCLCQKPVGAERDLLIDVLFRMAHRQPRREVYQDGPRRRSLGLLLSLIPREGLSAVPQTWMLQEAINIGLGRTDNRVPPAFVEETYGLGCMALRWFFRHALETVWAGFGRLLVIENRPLGLDPQPYVECLLERSDNNSPWRPQRERTLSEVLAQLPNDSTTERTGYDLIRDNLTTDPATAALIACAQLSMLCDRIERFDQKNDAWFHSFLSLGEVEHVSLHVFADLYDPTMKFGAWVRMLVERFAIGQHLYTASRKWPRTDGFFFQPTERGYELTRHNKVWWPDHGPTKIPTAFRLMADLDLLVERHGTWFRTDRGDRLLQDLIKSPGDPYPKDED